MTDALGNQEGSTVKYLPFGEARATIDIPTDKLFTGQRLDSTGLYYYNARYYDPTIGRFISADTIVQSMMNPQCLNRFSYALNNPLKYTDPSGHDAYSDTINFCENNDEYIQAVAKIITEAKAGVSYEIGIAIGGMADSLLPTNIIDIVSNNTPERVHEQQSEDSLFFLPIIPGRITINKGDLGHIFRDETNHFLQDTALNRRILLDCANGKGNWVGHARSGNDIYTSTYNGRQVWTYVRDGQIVNGGINENPYYLNSNGFWEKVSFYVTPSSKYNLQTNISLDYWLKGYSDIDPFR